MKEQMRGDEEMRVGGGWDCNDATIGEGSGHGLLLLIVNVRNGLKPRGLIPHGMDETLRRLHRRPQAQADELAGTEAGLFGSTTDLNTDTHRRYTSRSKRRTGTGSTGTTMGLAARGRSFATRPNIYKRVSHYAGDGRISGACDWSSAPSPR